MECFDDPNASLSDYSEWRRQNRIDPSSINDFAFYLTAAREAGLAAGCEGRQ
jgi:hypothetical protein